MPCDLHFTDFGNTLVSEVFDGFSCVRKIRHLLLAYFEDVSSFLNQLKSKGYLKILRCIILYCA